MSRGDGDREADRGGERVAPAGLPQRAAWRELWPWLALPPLAVAAAVLWLWLGAEGGFMEAGRYRIS